MNTSHALSSDTDKRIADTLERIALAMEVHVLIESDNLPEAAFLLSHIVTTVRRQENIARRLAAKKAEHAPTTRLIQGTP